MTSGRIKRALLWPIGGSVCFDIYFSTQLHVIHPFGYAGDQTGLQQYTLGLTEIVQQKGPEDAEVKELQQLSRNAGTHFSSGRST